MRLKFVIQQKEEEGWRASKRRCQQRRSYSPATPAVSVREGQTLAAGRWRSGAEASEGRRGGRARLPCYRQRIVSMAARSIGIPAGAAGI